MAVASDGSLYSWGSSNAGGSDVGGASKAPSITGVTTVASTDHAFAALAADGSVVAWGDPGEGGTGEPSANGYTRLFSSTDTFVAVQGNPGSLYVWGTERNSFLSAFLSGVFTEVYSNDEAWVAMKSDGSLHTWGPAASGGTGAPANNNINPFIKVFSNARAFVAMRADGVRFHSSPRRRVRLPPLDWGVSAFADAHFAPPRYRRR